MDILGLISINDWLLLFLGLLGLLYFYTTRGLDYWTKQGIPGPKPLPFFLNYKYLAKEGFKWDTRLVKEYGKTVGAFEGMKPFLITTDDDIMRDVFVKEFSNFSNRRVQQFPEKAGLNKSLVIIDEEQHWKRIRDMMSPTFSSGKLKQMTDRINECSKLHVKVHADKAAKGEEINLKESFSPVSMGLISTVAFGIDMNNKETYEEFSKMGERVLSNQTGSAIFLQIMNFIAPKFTGLVTKVLNIDIMDFGPFIYFGKIVDQILESRQKGEKATDFIQLMANANMEGTEEPHKVGDGMTREEIVANGVTFFIAGFDTVSTGLSVLFYRLAINPEAQEKAFKEVAQILDKKEHIDYEDLQKMTYLDWCMSEALRMNPPGIKIERQSKEAITIKGIKLEKGMLVGIPVLALHYDEERWENPNVFRPERFSEEEKKDRSPFSWMPFGYGPRNCIGMRLALLELKIVAAHTLYNFKMEPCSKTQIPLQTTTFGIVRDGVDVKITKR